MSVALGFVSEVLVYAEAAFVQVKGRILGLF